MKKIFATLMLVLACNAMQAQSADRIFNEFKNTKGAEYVPITKSMLSMAKNQKKNLMDGKIQLNGDIASAISSMQVLNMEECPKEVRQSVCDRVNALKDHGYEVLVSTNEEDEEAIILSKTKGENIVEVLIYSNEKDDKDCVLVQFKGSISQKELQKMLGNNNK